MALDIRTWFVILAFIALIGSILLDIFQGRIKYGYDFHRASEGLAATFLVLYFLKRFGVF